MEGKRRQTAASFAKLRKCTGGKEDIYMTVTSVRLVLSRLLQVHVEEGPLSEVIDCKESKVG